MSKTTTSTAVAAGAPDLKRDYVYDGCGSRVMKQVSGRNTAGTVWLLEKELRCLDEGSNLVAEVASLKPGSTTVRAMKPLRSYQWGEDLSGTETGAGGVGGLLWCLEYHTASQTSGMASGKVGDEIGSERESEDAATGEEESACVSG